MIYDWAHAMGKRCGYRKQTRMEHWQEAIDSVYSALEAKLQDIDTSRIMSEKKWEIMMLAGPALLSRTYCPLPPDPGGTAKNPSVGEK